VLAVALLLAGPCPGRAAQKFTETFTTPSTGWVAQAAGAVVAFTNSQVLVRFGAQGGVPMPESGILVATNTSAAGAFVGDYRAAGIECLGFSVRATGAVPSQVLVYLESQTGLIFRALGAALATTGVWYAVGAALDGAAPGGWAESTPGCFDSVLADVRQVRLQVARNGGLAQACQIDDFYLGGRPAAIRCTAAAGDGDQVTWTELRPNLVYTMQRASRMDGDWSDLGAFAATGSEHTVALPVETNGATGFYRLLQ
jgi:hypothetical protein